MRVRIKTRLRWLEVLFLLTGLIALDYYIWVNVDAKLSQIYSDWKFDTELRGGDASVRTFITDEHGLRRILGFGSSPSSLTKAPLPHIPPARKRAPKAQAKARRPRPDQLLGRLEIPRLKIRVMVREGDNSSTLEHAVGHIPSTALPGDPGNVALAAHRDTYFRPLRFIRKNDKILLSTLDGSYEYAVRSTKIVNPSDVSVLKASAPHELTLVTCYPFYYVGAAPRRFIVHAVQVASNTNPSLARNGGAARDSSTESLSR